MPAHLEIMPQCSTWSARTAQSGRPWPPWAGSRRSPRGSSGSLETLRRRAPERILIGACSGRAGQTAGSGPPVYPWPPFAELERTMVNRYLSLSIALALALCACAPAQQPTKPLYDRDKIMKESTAYYNYQDDARKELAAFELEPPDTCTSEHLAKATANSEGMLKNYTTENLSINMNADVTAALFLDIADAAAAATCPIQARAIYKCVISVFAGTYRQRAEIALVREELAAFELESPGTCTSGHLAKATADSEEMLKNNTTGDFNMYADAAALFLDIADAAAAATCPIQARAIYKRVISVFVGTGYEGYRQRAEIGLAEIRGK